MNFVGNRKLSIPDSESSFITAVTAQPHSFASVLFASFELFKSKYTRLFQLDCTYLLEYQNHNQSS